ncbi:MAG: response regulator [Hydrogenophaga sp.]|uniref:response regulator n=1 Tax=Hydrogenophaga sp. TaxID=1904254 RepID=UPI001D7D1C48|nr:response regulator [Hydrogenophaga sp.]MBX3609634.1 response regulator [Hydrogenophaga sp.]
MSLRVMMVDDNESDLLFTRVTLQRCGVPCEVIEFERAQDALAHLAADPRHGVRVVLLDINMPVMDGFAFLDAFEALAPDLRAQTAVIMLSSSSDPGDRARAQTYASVAGYLTKPLDRAEAAKLLERFETQ